MPDRRKLGNLRMLEIDTTRRAFVAAMTALLSGTYSGLIAAQPARLTIGANPAGTNFNLVAGGFAKVLQESLEIPSIVRPYSGSSVYIPMLQRGEIALGMNSGIDSYLSFTGQQPYPAAMSRLRALLAVYPLGYMYWVRKNSGLRRIEDLRDKRVVVNYRGLVVLDRLNRAILASGGLTDEDIRPVTSAGLPEGARAVLEGRADAVAMGYRLPLVSQMNAAIPGGLQFLTMGADESKVAELMPGAWVTSVDPGPATVGIETPTRISSYQTYLNTGTHLDDETAYRIVRALHRGWPELREDFAVLAPVEPDAVAPSDSPHPYHPGAIRYFKEIGLWTGRHDENQALALAGA